MGAVPLPASHTPRCGGIRSGKGGSHGDETTGGGHGPSSGGARRGGWRRQWSPSPSATASPSPWWPSPGRRPAARGGVGGALGVLLLATALASDGDGARLRRGGWLIALVVGVLSGCTCAGTLVEAGIPSLDAPLAVLAFNLGIAVAQLAALALAPAAGRFLARQLPGAPPPMRGASWRRSGASTASLPECRAPQDARAIRVPWRGAV